jgi:hypothetical protein
MHIVQVRLLYLLTYLLLFYVFHPVAHKLYQVWIFFLSYLILLTPLSRVLLQQLTCFNKFPAFYGNRRFFTAFTSASHQSLSYSLVLWLSVWTFRNMTRFYGEMLAPRPTPKLEDHPLSALYDCLFNIFAATVHIRGRSSFRNLRTRHAVVTGTHLSQVRFITFQWTIWS